MCFITSSSPGDSGRGLFGTGKEKFLPSALGGGLLLRPSKLHSILKVSLLYAIFRFLSYISP